jgi:hypothetical protein
VPKCRTASGRPDAAPGVVGAIQTFGQLIHALVSEGVFLPETGAFLPLPKLATEPFLKLWEQEVFALLLAEGKITDERKGWAALVKQVYEADSLLCPRCGSAMRIIAFIERHQTEVIEKILRHCGLWEERGPPPAPKPAVS